MIDVIGHVSNLDAWMDALEAQAPEYVETDGDDRRLTLPARTPSVQRLNDDGTVSALIYARVPPEIVALVDALPGSTVLAQVPTDLADIRGTIDRCYSALFSDPDAVALYDAVYDRTPREVDDGDGGTVTVTPPDRFGAVG